jgi:hypothetical protein
MSDKAVLYIEGDFGQMARMIEVNRADTEVTEAKRRAPWQRIM